MLADDSAPTGAGHLQLHWLLSSGNVDTEQALEWLNNVNMLHQTEYKKTDWNVLYWIAAGSALDLLEARHYLMRLPPCSQMISFTA